MSFVPMPFHSLLLFAVWLLLNNSVSPGNILLGSFFALSIPWLVNGMWGKPSKIRHPWLATVYLVTVLKDVLTANIQVALLVIGPLHKLQPGFIAIPIDLSSDVGITVLASTVSLTPGTVSVEVSEDKRWLYIHVLHLEHEQDLINDIKQRYEKPIKEILGC